MADTRSLIVSKSVTSTAVLRSATGVVLGTNPSRSYFLIQNQSGTAALRILLGNGTISDSNYHISLFAGSPSGTSEVANGVGGGIFEMIGPVVYTGTVTVASQVADTARYSIIEIS